MAASYRPINVKEHFGAKGDGVTDDTAAIQAAIDTGKTVYIPAGTYNVQSKIDLDVANQRVYGDGIGKTIISCPEDWTTTPVFAVAGSRVVIDSLSIIETNASPTNVDKAGPGSSNNIGIDVQSTYVKIQKVQVKGFRLPIVIRDLNTSGRGDHCQIISCEISHGYEWGIEIDSTQHVVVENTYCHTNGLDGIKLQNEYNRFCTGTQIRGCTLSNNGQRDIAAGGSENSNGNGIDVYHGGFQFTMTDCVCKENYGAGFVIKGTASTTPDQGQFSVVNCHFINNLQTQVAAGGHGVEIGLDGVMSPLNLHFIGCTMSGNANNGIAIYGGAKISFTSCNSMLNGIDGVRTTDGGARDISFLGCNFIANTLYNARIGLSNSGARNSCRWKFIGCRFYGTMDNDLDNYQDPRETTEGIVTEIGIRIYSSMTDVAIDNCFFANHDSTTASILVGGDATITDTEVYGAERTAIYITANAKLIMRRCLISECDFSISASNGAILVNTGLIDVDDISFIQSALTASSRAIRIQGGASPCVIGQLSTTNYANQIILDSAIHTIRNVRGSGTPESAIVAGIGSTFTRTDGGTNTTFYVKESGTGNTGWTPISRRKEGQDSLGIAPSALVINFDSGNYDNKTLVLFATDCTLTLSATRPGLYHIIATQASAGNEFIYPNNVLWSGAPTQPVATINSVSVIQLYFDGANFHGA